MLRRHDIHFESKEINGHSLYLLMARQLETASLITYDKLRNPTLLTIGVVSSDYSIISLITNVKVAQTAVRTFFEFS